MALSAVDHKAISKAIRLTLLAHVRAPFHTLREAGLQADLRERLRSHLEPKTVQVAEPTPSDRRGAFPWASGSVTSRVAMEMKVIAEPSPQITTIDVIVLEGKDPVRLQWREGGPGDVIAQIALEHIAAAIEIKASPSRAAERTRYAQDMYRLLHLAQSGIAGFFVLADKSIGLYGDRTEAPQTQDDWLESEQVHRVCRLRVSGAAPSRSRPSAEIEVWDIAWTGTRWMPRVRIVRRDE